MQLVNISEAGVKLALLGQQHDQTQQTLRRLLQQRADLDERINELRQYGRKVTTEIRLINEAVKQSVMWV